MQQTAAIEAGICVRDLDRMHRFYTTALGCEEVRRADIPKELSAALGVAAEGYECVWLKTPMNERIKLMHPALTPDTPAAPGMLTERTGLHYLTFYCSDLDACLAAAQAQGATLISARALIAPDRPLKLCFFRDPEGNVIELVEAAAAVS
ncbi:MAG: VOC family protein [Pseudomonadales bacterium]|nr:VOC family protein [Pseudomonadales bacterium]MCP5184960.1 VOC family protein [Pseudomonadales bacterium]